MKNPKKPTKRLTAQRWWIILYRGLPVECHTSLKDAQRSAKWGAQIVEVKEVL